MTVSAVPLPSGLWSSVGKLLRLQALITYNNIRRANLRRKIGYGFLALLVVAVLVGVFAGSWALLGLLRSPEVAPYVAVGGLLESIPVLALTAAFFVLVVTSFGVLLQSLYLSGDMEFLLSAPVSIRAVFVAKLIEAILPDFGLVCLFGLPILFGLGAAGGFNLVYYPLVILVLMALALALSGLTSLLVMAVVRVVPARRVAELLGFFGAIFSILLSQSGQLANTMRFSRTQFSGALSNLSRLDAPWSPLSWAGHGLIDIAHGNWLPGLGLLAIFFILAAVAFYLALVTAERLYFTGWSRVQAGTHRRRQPARPGGAAAVRPHASAVPSAPAVAFPLFAWLPRTTRAIIAKDYRVLTRDLRNMSQVVTPLIFGIIYTIAITRTNRIGEDPDVSHGVMLAMQSLTVYASVAISLFVSWGLLSRLALISFSHEGRSYWLIKSTPSAARQILLAKYLVAYIPGVLLGLLFLTVTSLLQHATFGTVLYSAVMLLFSLSGAAGVNLAFGVAGANMNWQSSNPRAMQRGTYGCAASLVSMAYLVLIVAIFFGPPVGFGLLNFPETYGRIIGLLLGAAASLACAIFPPLAVLNRIDRLGEDK
jgi:ABC-2 type transport system permease protein